MLRYEFDAVEYDGNVYCVNCLPSEATVYDEEVTPIMDCDFYDTAPVCKECGEVHDYMHVGEVVCQ